MKRAACLDRAKALVTRQRQAQHGSFQETYGAIAIFWSRQGRQLCRPGWIHGAGLRAAAAAGARWPPMTTSLSPLRVLKAQADKIAALVKAAERGEKIEGQFAEKIEAARRLKATFKVGVVMDDKLISIEMPWATISSTSEVGLAEYILKQMRGARDPVH
jgi:hypothetical protein